MNVARVAFYLTCASAVAILVSIAASQILLGLAIAALLISGAPLKFPPIKLPLALFMGWTLLSVIFSSAPGEGTPQIRKLIIFLMLLLVASTFHRLAEIRGMVLCMGVVVTASAIVSLYQFWRKVQEARALHKNFYDYYVPERITGFTSHWMTFGGEEMMVLLMLFALLFFSVQPRWKVVGWACVVIVSVSLVLGYTRSIFELGLPLGACYLIWFWKKWVLLAAPLVLLLGLAISPLRERILSPLTPHGDTDSNRHRMVTRAAGFQMIKTHPLFGLGPEVMKDRKTFETYVPASIARPLPPGWYGHLHNIYLQYAAERGIPALLFMLWVIGKMIRDFAVGLQRRNLDPEARFVLHGALAVIIGILAEGFLEYNLGDSEVLTVFLVVMGFGYIALQSAEARAADCGAPEVVEVGR